MSGQNIILLLSIMYIYLLSDLFYVITNGPDLMSVTKLCVPLFGNIGIRIIDKISVYFVDFNEWWNQSMSSYSAVSIFFTCLLHIRDTKIHLDWDKICSYSINILFLGMFVKIFYNFIFLFNFSIVYLMFSLLCSYSVYMKFSSSGVAMITLCGKLLEVGSSIILSSHLDKIDEYSNYCIKNKNSWVVYIIKVFIGHHGKVDIDGEIMAKQIGKYIGTSYEECVDMYDKNPIRRVASAIGVVK